MLTPTDDHRMYIKFLVNEGNVVGRLLCAFCPINEKSWHAANFQHELDGEDSPRSEWTGQRLARSGR